MIPNRHMAFCPFDLSSSSTYSNPLRSNDLPLILKESVGSAAACSQGMTYWPEMAAESKGSPIVRKSVCTAGVGPTKRDVPVSRMPDVTPAKEAPSTSMPSRTNSQ